MIYSGAQAAILLFLDKLITEEWCTGMSREQLSMSFEFKVFPSPRTVAQSAWAVEYTDCIAAVG